jgi:hypothetical protein
MSITKSKQPNFSHSTSIKNGLICFLLLFHYLYFIEMVIQSTFPSIKVPEVGIIQFLFSNPYKTPEDRKILIDAFTGESLTLAQLKDNILRFAASLQDKFQFKRGDVVSLYSPNQVSLFLVGIDLCRYSSIARNRWIILYLYLVPLQQVK